MARMTSSRCHGASTSLSSTPFDATASPRACGNPMNSDRTGQISGLLALGYRRRAHSAATTGPTAGMRTITRESARVMRPKGSCPTVSASISRCSATLTASHPRARRHRRARTSDVICS